MSALLAPASVAFVGVSRDEQNLGRRAMHHVRTFGFAGPVDVVHPSAPEIDGIKAVPTVSDLARVPDLAVICTDGDRALALLEDCVRAGVPGVILLANHGAVVEDTQQVRRVAGSTTRVMGPNSPGYVNVGLRLAPCISSFLDRADLVPGPVAIVSQSGAGAAMITQRLQATGAGISWLIGTGNEADVDVGAYLSYLAQAGDLTAVGLFVESIRDPASFRRGLEDATTSGLRVCALKVGRTRAGQRAALTHSGALSGPLALFQGELQRTGARLCEGLDDFVACLAAATMSTPRLRSVAVAATSGGFAGMVADAAVAAGLAVPELAGLENPWDTDIAVVRDPEGTARVWAAALNDPAVGSGILGVSPISETAMERFAAALPPWESVKPYFVVVPGDALAPSTERDVHTKARLARSVESAAAALAWWSHSAHDDPSATAANSQAIDESQGKRLLQRLGIAVPRSVTASTAEEATSSARTLQPPLVVKVLRPALLHKAAAGGVVLGIDGAEDAIANAWNAIRDKLRTGSGLELETVLIEEQVPPGIDLLVATRSDALYGPYLVVGAGGGNVEAIADTGIVLLPAEPGDLVRCIDGLRISDVLAQVAALESSTATIPTALLDVLTALQSEALRSPGLEVEINPLRLLFARPQAVALDCVLSADVALAESTSIR